MYRTIVSEHIENTVLTETEHVYHY